MNKITDLKGYKKKKEEPIQVLGYFSPMLMTSHPREKLHLGYVSEEEGEYYWCYKLMSKLTPQGHIMYVFYEQYTDNDVDSPWYGERVKGMIHADVVYSKSSFYRRVAKLKKAYGIKKFACVRLGVG